MIAQPTRERRRPSRALLRREIGALEAALRHQANDRGDAAEVRAAVMLVARHAQATGIPPEQAVIVIKRTLDAIVRGPDEQSRYALLRDQFITLAIAAYYSRRGGRRI